jgi:hypothetical protein
MQRCNDVDLTTRRVCVSASLSCWLGGSTYEEEPIKSRRWIAAESYEVAESGAILLVLFCKQARRPKPAVLSEGLLTDQVHE